MRDGKEGPSHREHCNSGKICVQIAPGTRLGLDGPGSRARKDGCKDVRVILGSGWILKRIIKLDITPAKSKLLKGSSKISLPVGLRGGKKLINMNNEDDYCFMCATTRALNMVKKDLQRITPEFRKQAEELNWEDIEFPTPCSERTYKKFEENNNVSLLVFGHEETETGINIIPLYVP